MLQWLQHHEAIRKLRLIPGFAGTYLVFLAAEPLDVTPTNFIHRICPSMLENLERSFGRELKHIPVSPRFAAVS